MGPTARSPMQRADTADPGDTLQPERYGDCSVTRVSSVTGIGASDPVGTIDRLAAELLSQAEGNPAITITDHVKALDYFRARAMADEAERKSAAKPPQPERPSALRKLSVVAEIIRTWPGARSVEFIDE
jgi:hypothetical protein